MATVARPGRGPKEYTSSVLHEVLSVLDGPKPEPSKLSGKDVIKAAYTKILAWRSEGISYEDIAQIFAQKVPSFKLNAKVLRRYMADLETELGPVKDQISPELEPISPISEPKAEVSKTSNKPKKNASEKPAHETARPTNAPTAPESASNEPDNAPPNPDSAQFNELSKDL